MTAAILQSKLSLRLAACVFTFLGMVTGINGAHASGGLDTPSNAPAVMPFSIQGVEIMQLTPAGLGITGILNTSSSVGINLGASAPTQMLDVNGYVRIRTINGEGGTIQLDGANGVTMYVENLNGVFRLVNSPWSLQLFSVDQSGNVAASGEITGNLKFNGGQLRMIGGGYGAIWRNDGANTYFLLTDSGNQSGTWNTLRPLYIDDVTGMVNFNQGITINGNGLSITAGGLNVTGGNVGIGTAMPQATLEVWGTIKSPIHSNRYSVPISTLNYWHNGCMAPASMTVNPAGVENPHSGSDPSGADTTVFFSADCVAACDRYCYNAQNYSGGTITEYNSATQYADCVCSP